MKWSNRLSFSPARLLQNAKSQAAVWACSASCRRVVYASQDLFFSFQMLYHLPFLTPTLCHTLVWTVWMFSGSLFVFAFLCLVPSVFKAAGSAACCFLPERRAVSSQNVFHECEVSDTQSLCTFVILNFMCSCSRRTIYWFKGNY